MNETQKVNMDEIREAFNTETQKRVDELHHYNSIYESQINKNKKEISRLGNILSAEHDKVANKLDKTHPGWRNVLVQYALKNRK